MKTSAIRDNGSDATQRMLHDVKGPDYDLDNNFMIVFMGELDLPGVLRPRAASHCLHVWTDVDNIVGTVSLKKDQPRGPGSRTEPSGETAAQTGNQCGSAWWWWCPVRNTCCPVVDHRSTRPGRMDEAAEKRALLGRGGEQPCTGAPGSSCDSRDHTRTEEQRNPQPSDWDTALWS